MTKSEFLRSIVGWFKKLHPDAIGVVTRNGGPTYKKLFVEFDHEYTDEDFYSQDAVLSTAETLAVAVLSGDDTAADPLVDYLQENGMDAIAEAKRQERERVVECVRQALRNQVGTEAGYNMSPTDYVIDTELFWADIDIGVHELEGK